MVEPVCNITFVTRYGGAGMYVLSNKLFLHEPWKKMKYNVQNIILMEWLQKVYKDKI